MYKIYMTVTAGGRGINIEDLYLIGLTFTKKDTRLKVVNAHYLGAEGGLALACEPPTKANQNMMVNSITHLKLDPKHPFYKELRAYQLSRIAWLAEGHRRNGLITQI